MVDPHRLAELRSLAYHRAIVERFEVSGARALALRRIESGWGAGSQGYRHRWRALLEGPDHVLFERMTADDEDGRALRQGSPFAGLLDPRERWDLWARVRAEVAS